MRKSCWQQEQRVINVYMHGDQHPPAAIRCKTQSWCCGLKYCRCGLKCKMYRMYDTAAWHCRCCWHAVLAARAMWVPVQQHCTDSKHLPHRPAPRSRECSLLGVKRSLPDPPAIFSFPLTPLLPPTPHFTASRSRGQTPRRLHCRCLPHPPCPPCARDCATTSRGCALLHVHSRHVFTMCACVTCDQDCAANRIATR